MIMGRPRKVGDDFSYDDLAVVGGITKSAVRHVADAGLLPADEKEEVRMLKRVAVIGGFIAAGVPLMAAAQVADAVQLEFNQYDGETPSGLGNLWRKLPRDEIRATPNHNDYWLHQALRGNPEIYKPGLATDSDVIVQIADREFVFAGTLHPFAPTLEPFAPDGVSSGTSPVGRIEGWRRGVNPRFIHFSEAVPLFDDDLRPTAEAQALHNSFIAARENAIGIITVNLSLAIRNGLDRLAERRAKHERKKS